MFDLTYQERQVILFFISVALIGLGINFAVKINSRIECTIKEASDVVKIDINHANLEDLLGVSGITPNLAKKIIQYRMAHGPFKSLRELKEIRGIGDYRYEKLKDFVRIK